MEQHQLSDNFNLAEGTHSATASLKHIPNIPSSATIAVMRQTALGMERVRAALGNKAIHVNSWYRSPEVNKAVGSKPTSQHVLGEAVDFVCPDFGTPADICRKLIQLKELIRYDQLILEHTWVHISFAITSMKPRGQVLSLLASGGYATGLTDKLGKTI